MLLGLERKWLRSVFPVKGGGKTLRLDGAVNIELAR